MPEEQCFQKRASNYDYHKSTSRNPNPGFHKIPVPRQYFQSLEPAFDLALNISPDITGPKLMDGPSGRPKCVALEGPILRAITPSLIVGVLTTGQTLKTGYSWDSNEGS